MVMGGSSPAHNGERSTRRELARTQPTTTAPVAASSWDHVRPGLVDLLAEPLEVRRDAGAAQVAHVGGDGAAGEFPIGLRGRSGESGAEGCGVARGASAAH